MIDEFSQNLVAKAFGHILPDKYADSGFIPRIVGRSSDAETLLILVSAGVGITILPESIVRNLGHATDLAFIPLEGEHEHVDIMAMWKPESTNPVTQVFSEFLIAERDGTEV